MKYTAILVLALLLVGGATWATLTVNDGLSYNTNGGGTGHFSNPAGTYPTMMAPGTGWTITPVSGNAGQPTAFYTAVGGTGWTWTGVYDYDDYTWITGTGTEGAFGVICDVEMWCTDAMPTPLLYFHEGAGKSIAMDGILTELVASNNGEWYGITKNSASHDQSAMSKLVYLSNGFGTLWADQGESQGNTVQAPTIPVTWQYSTDGTTWFTPTAQGGNNNQTWALYTINALPKGPFTIQWKATIHPTDFQSDGRYFLDPIVVAAPEL
jgi:hypothetical protein